MCRRPPAPLPRGVLTKPPEDEAPPEANPTEKPSNGPQSEPSKKRPAPATHFAVLTCLDGVSATDPYDRPALEKQLEKVHHVLLCDTSFRDRKMYRSCPEDSRATLYQFLEAGGAAQQEGASEAPARRQKSVDDYNIDLFNSVDAVFRFFFPAGSAGLPTVGKYWGAIGRVLRVRTPGLQGGVDPEVTYRTHLTDPPNPPRRNLPLQRTRHGNRYTDLRNSTSPAQC